MNLSGVENVTRGGMLGRPFDFGTTSSFLAHLRRVRNLEEDLSSRGAFHLHLGSGSWPVQLRIIGNDSTEIVCLLRSRDGIPLQTGDRLILRETGRRSVVAGGTVLDPHPPQTRAELQHAIPILLDAVRRGPDEIADSLLEVRGTAGVDELSRDSGGGVPSSRFRTGDLVMAEDAAAELLRAITRSVTAFHEQHRLRPGMQKATLSSSLGVSSDSITMVVAGAEELVEDGATVRLAGFEPGLAPAEQELWEVAERKLVASLAVPRASQLGLGTELLHALIRDGQLIRVGDDLVYLPDQIREITAVLGRLGDGFTVAEFRDMAAVTRRQAIPLLEWFDKQGTTIRRGDTRAVRPSADRSKSAKQRPGSGDAPSP